MNNWPARVRSVASPDVRSSEPAARRSDGDLSGRDRQCDAAFASSAFMWDLRPCVL